MKMLVALKPCPFCGGKARISFFDAKFGGQNYIGDKKLKYRVQVICNKCHSRGKPIMTDWLINPNPYAMIGTIVPNTRSEEQAKIFVPYIDKAAEAWNNRKDGDGEPIEGGVDWGEEDGDIAVYSAVNGNDGDGE